MSTTTTYYDLVKPATGEAADITVINENMDIVDATLHEIAESGGGGGITAEIDGPVTTTTPQTFDGHVSSEFVFKVDPTYLSISDKASTASLTQHTGDSTVHITSSERTAWNGKQNALNADQIRKITISTSDPTGGSDGDIWLKYE